MIGWLRGHNLTPRLKQPVDELWDRRLGVRTFGYHAGSGTWGTAGWTAHYQPLSYTELFAAFKAANVGRDDLLTDLGSGLGRALFAASHAGAGRVVGVELVPELAEAGEANRRRSRLADRDIRVIEGDALLHPLGDTTVLYLFHALSEQNFTTVIENVRADRKAAGRSGDGFRVIYANPVFENVLAASGWLKHRLTLPPNPGRFTREAGYAVSIWDAED